MSLKGIRYPKEFKQRVVDLYHAGNSVIYLSKNFSVTNQTIYRWIKELSPVNKTPKDETIIKDYEICIAQLKKENHSLKNLIKDLL